MSNIGKKIIIAPGRWQGGKLLPGNATYDTLAKRLTITFTMSDPTALLQKRLWINICNTSKKTEKGPRDPKVSTPIKFLTEPRAKLKNSTHTCTADNPDEVNLKTLCSILSFPIGLSLYPSEPKEFCDCSRGTEKLKTSPMTKDDGKSTSHRGKRGTPKKPPDPDDNSSKQVKIKTSKKTRSN